jgi:ketosteroid isomerase-like protein
MTPPAAGLHRSPPHRLSPIFVLLLAAGCSPASFDATAEAPKLLARDAEWAQAAADGKDVEKIVSYWSDDAVVIPQGQPVAVGKAAIRDFVTDSLRIPGFRIHWVSDQVTFSPDGKLAYMLGTSETTVPGPTGALMTLPGRSVTVWRLEPDGRWQCVLDIWNDPPTAVSPSQANEAAPRG